MPWRHRHTTPEATELQALLARMRDAGVHTVALEVSSHALAQHRVDGTWFAAACFTNLSHDHLDFHRDVDAYFEAKAASVRTGAVRSRGQTSTIPTDATSPCTRVHAGSTCSRIALDDPNADVGAESVKMGTTAPTSCSSIAVRVDASTVQLPLLGRVNVANALAAAAVRTRDGRLVRPVSPPDWRTPR